MVSNRLSSWVLLNRLYVNVQLRLDPDLERFMLTYDRFRPEADFGEDASTDSDLRPVLRSRCELLGKFTHLCKDSST
jgi:hypothetical protein